MFRKDIHFAWCSEHFDSEKLGAYQLGSGTPPSSNPASIYRDLLQAVKTHDKGNLKISQQKSTLQALAVRWRGNNEITDEELQEISLLIETSDFKDWRPLIYIIPRDPVKDRLSLVPVDQRASGEREYRIVDLRRDEFDVIEPIQC